MRRGAGRRVVGLDRAAVMEAFADFLDETTYDVNQVRYMTTVIDELTANGVMEPSRLYESPFTDDLPSGPDDAFSDADIIDIARRLRSFTTHAQTQARPA